MKIRSLFLALGMALVPSASNATLWWSTWDSFSGTSLPQPADTNTFPFDPPDAPYPNMTLSGSATTVATGGSNDGSFAEIDTDFLKAGKNNGYVNVARTTPGTTRPSAIFTITNIVTEYPLLYVIRLSFDMLRTAGLGLGEIRWRVGSETDIFTPVPAGGGNNTPLSGDWTDYTYTAAVPVGQGEKIDITFTAANAASGFVLDNIAIIAVPETGSVVGLTALLTSGLMMRHRRRKPSEVPAVA